MNILLKTWVIIGLVVFGVIVDRLWMHFRRGKLRAPINPLPTTTPAISGSEHDMLQFYLQEWEVIINTQMHFNDLILRFRSIILSVFVALIGASVALEKIVSLSRSDLFLIYCLPSILWVTAFIIDFGYYHRLLLGSVAQALKFDNSENLRSYGLFGMTTCISEHVHPPTSKLLVFFYYFFPFMLISILLLWRFK